MTIYVAYEGSLIILVKTTMQDYVHFPFKIRESTIGRDTQTKAKLDQRYENIQLRSQFRHPISCMLALMMAFKSYTHAYKFLYTLLQTYYHILDLVTKRIYDIIHIYKY